MSSTAKSGEVGEESMSSTPKSGEVGQESTMPSYNPDVKRSWDC